MKVKKSNYATMAAHIRKCKTVSDLDEYDAKLDRL